MYFKAIKITIVILTLSTEILYFELNTSKVKIQFQQNHYHIQIQWVNLSMD